MTCAHSCRLWPLSLVLVLWAPAAGCGHDGLEFDLDEPESASTGADAGHQQPEESSDSAGVGAGGHGRADHLGSPDTQDAARGSAAPEQDSAPDDNWHQSSSLTTAGLDEFGRPRFDSDPRGWPTGDDEWGPGCEELVAQPELCGTGIDEDCDGQVDEHRDIGTACTPTDARQGCGEQRAFYVCETGTDNLVCVPLGCRNEEYDPERCGNGFVDPGEQCDPMAPGEVPEQTCRPDCRKPFFERCVFSDGQRPCPGGYTCEPWVRACIAQIGQYFSRCPEIAIDREQPEGPFYPMVEIQPEDESEPKQCWISCTDTAQCPASLSHCYQGFCVVDF